MSLKVEGYSSIGRLLVNPAFLDLEAGELKLKANLGLKSE